MLVLRIVKQFFFTKKEIVQCVIVNVWRVLNYVS